MPVVRHLAVVLLGVFAITAVTALSQDDPFGPTPRPKDLFAPQSAQPDPFGEAPKETKAKQKKTKKENLFGGNDPFGPEPPADKPPKVQPPRISNPFGSDPFGPKPTKGQPSRNATRTISAPRTSEARNEEARQRLAREGAVEFIDTPLVEVVDYFADMLDVQVYVDRRALDDEGISEDEVIDIFLKKVPGEMALDLVLRQLDLTWYLREGVIIVTTHEAAQADQRTRVYSVKLIAGSGNLPPPKLASQFGAGLGGLGGMDDGGMGPQSLPSSASNEVERLAQVIETTCSPELWERQGGPGVITTYRHALVVTQTYRVHQQIDELLRQLKSADVEK